MSKTYQSFRISFDLVLGARTTLRGGFATWHVRKLRTTLMWQGAAMS